LLFPTAVFRHEGDATLEELSAIRHPDGRRLFLHQPPWQAVRERFWGTLPDVYRRLSQRGGLRYVSLFDVRDEVCRRLRLSPALFERCLGLALEEPLAVAGWRISVESDVREEMRAGGQRERRSISVGGIPFSIIALAKLPTRTSAPGGRSDASSSGRLSIVGGERSLIDRWRNTSGRKPVVMADIVLDTDALADFLAQFFSTAERGFSAFKAGEWLSEAAARIINRVVRLSHPGYSPVSFVVASTFAFLEIVRKWDQLLGERVRPYQMRAFLESPPAWFLIAAVDSTLVPFYCRLPSAVQMLDGSVKPIEWTDAIQVATALSRNEPDRPPCALATNDRRLIRIEEIAGECV
jgi:hypothetical protein